MGYRPITLVVCDPHYRTYYFRALTICFIICGLLATILIAIHDWGKPISKCDMSEARFQIDTGALPVTSTARSSTHQFETNKESYQTSQLYNTVLRIKNHERSQVSAGDN